MTDFDPLNNWSNYSTKELVALRNLFYTGTGSDSVVAEIEDELRWR